MLSAMKLLFALCLACFSFGTSERAPAPLAHPAVVGASVSAGVGLDPSADPLQGQQSKLRLSTVVDASIVGAHEASADFADFMFFSAPKPTAKRSVKDALDAKPSVLVALDYLFWLGYGPGDERARLGRLEEGLKALESVKQPVLLGDLPDFNGVQVSRMLLAPEAIPTRDVLDKLDARILEWSKAHKNVVLVPVRQMFQRLNSGEDFTLHGNKFDKDARARLMQKDGLHTTLEGTAALWILAVDAWLATKPAGLDEKAFVLDLERLVEAARKPKAPEKASKPAKIAPHG